MNKAQMLEEIKRITNEVKGLDFSSRMAVNNRHKELLLKSNVNTTKGGVVRFYLTKDASKAQVEDYLEQLINATYDVLRTCL